MISRDLPIADYLGSKRISNHKLKTLAQKGARGFYIAHEQKRWAEDDTQAYLAGRAIEDALQRPAEFRAKYIAKPPTSTKEGNFSTKEGKAWRDEQKAKGLVILESSDARASEALIQTLEQCPISQALISASQEQVTLMHEEVPSRIGLPGLQSRPDWLNFDGCGASEWRPYSLDLKTTIALSQLSNWKTIMRFGYHRQAAMTRLCLELEGIDASAFRWLLLGAEKSFPYRWRVIEMPTALVEDGYRWCLRWLDVLEGYYSTGEWPLVESEIVMVNVPSWIEPSDDVEEESEAA